MMASFVVKVCILTLLASFSTATPFFDSKSIFAWQTNFALIYTLANSVLHVSEASPIEQAANYLAGLPRELQEILSQPPKKSVKPLVKDEEKTEEKRREEAQEVTDLLKSIDESLDEVIPLLKDTVSITREIGKRLKMSSGKTTLPMPLMKGIPGLFKVSEVEPDCKTPECRNRKALEAIMNVDMPDLLSKTASVFFPGPSKPISNNLIYAREGLEMLILAEKVRSYFK